MMAYLWSVIVFFIADIQMCRTSGDLEHPPVRHIGVTKSGLPATIPGEISGTTDMTSVLKAHYMLNVTSRSMAAVGSTLKFDAVLLVLNHTQNLAATPDMFIYHWMNTATKQLTQTVDGLNSSVMVTFDSQKVAAGDYLMTVAAYLNDDQTIIVAFETKMFTLTRQLNGLLVLAQKLDYQRHANIFSTKAPVTLTADVHDQFLQSDLGYSYFWYQNSRLLQVTKQASYMTTFTQPFNSSLSTTIKVYTKSSAGDAQGMFSAHNESASLPSVKNASFSGSSDDGLIEFLIRSSSTKEAILTLGQQYKGRESSFSFKGSFLEKVEFKDAISDCVVTRIDADQQDRAVSVKKTASVNITCAGSTPSSVCVTITDMNSSLPANSACTPTLFVDKLDHIVTIQLASTGWKNAHFFVYNDVSRYQLVESFYGYDPDSLNVPALTIPIVFGVLGVLIIIIGGVYFVRLRKKPLVEVADFDFHPLLTRSQTQDKLFSFSRIANNIRAMLPQGSTETDSSRHGHRSTTRGHLSATRNTERNDALSQSLYESL